MQGYSDPVGEGHYLNKLSRDPFDNASFYISKTLVLDKRILKVFPVKKF